MKHILGGRMTAVAAFVLAFHFAAELALAQKPARVANEEGSMTPMLIAVGLIVVVSLSAFINPKRSHLN